MPSFEEYAEKYQVIRMVRRDGILQMTFTPTGAAYVEHRGHGGAGLCLC